MTVPYAVRKLRITFQLGSGDFGDGKSNVVTIGAGSGSVGDAGNLRALAVINQATAGDQGNLDLRIWGLTLDHINKLTIAGLQYDVRKNGVMIEAGDDTGGFTTVYNGTVIEAHPDFSDQRNASFVVFAMNGAIIQMKPVQPTSIQGSATVETVLQRVLQGTGFSLKNNGVNSTLLNPYLPGTAWDQINRVLRAVPCFGFLDSIAQVLSIWPTNGSAGGNSVISPETGMIGYPEFERGIIKVRQLFSPPGPKPGETVKVQSELTAANGSWVVQNVVFVLSSELPSGPWEMMITASRAETSPQA